jgi:transcriptional regulator GlxA family with amidase domain
MPGYVRRTEKFTRAKAVVPIRMERVATAAGCSIRTLIAVFRQFRETTPLAALHAIRLEGDACGAQPQRDRSLDR